MGEPKVDCIYYKETPLGFKCRAELPTMGGCPENCQAYKTE